MDAAMALVNRLLVQAQALSAVTAYLRLAAAEERENPALQKHIERIVDLLDAREALDVLTEQERAVVTSFARSYLHQALELIDEPGRANAWSHSDPTILQAQGSASAVVATLIDRSGLGRPGMRILDVGTGVAGLAIAFCRTFTGSTVVGLDPWEPALELARANVSKAELDSRITLHNTTIQSFEDDEGFDLVWLPSFFVPEAVLDSAFRRVRDILRPKGCLVVGILEGPEGPLSNAVDAMITVRSGGAILEPNEGIQRLERAGFTDVCEADRAWQAPLRLVVARQD